MHCFLFKVQWRHKYWMFQSWEDVFRSGQYERPWQFKRAGNASRSADRQKRCSLGVSAPSGKRVTISGETITVNSKVNEHGLGLWLILKSNFYYHFVFLRDFETVRLQFSFLFLCVRVYRLKKKKMLLLRDIFWGTYFEGHLLRDIFEGHFLGRCLCGFNVFVSLYVCVSLYLWCSRHGRQ